MNHQWVLSQSSGADNVGSSAAYWHQYTSFCKVCKLQRRINHYNYNFIIFYSKVNLTLSAIEYESCAAIMIKNILL